ncbi:MAG: hypothetical protein Q9174_002455 [Haloplaca sp. 1 TL-2023]
MSHLGFCTGSFNIIIDHDKPQIIEIKEITMSLVDGIESTLVAAIYWISTQHDDRNGTFRIMNNVVESCNGLLQLAGFTPPMITTKKGDLQTLLVFIRVTTLFIDSAVVSYVRSHGYGFDTAYFESEINSLNADEDYASWGFSCYWARLACLDAFLDGRQVWVFRQRNSLGRQSSRDLPSEPKSVLARMRDIASIWGPVYTIPSETGLVKYYGVSKGIICRVSTRKPCAVVGAVQCHYFTRFSFLKNKASKLLHGKKHPSIGEEIGPDDLLLVGGELKVNHLCKYSMRDFLHDWAPDTGVLGTHQSYWRSDTRTLALGVSKYLGITVSGTQKLIPETTRKQHILDKWTSTPARCNPAILRQYLGVEVSHCTGNARRMSLGNLMFTLPVRVVLERRMPAWTETPWGFSLMEALLGCDDQAIFRVWNNFVANRSDIAELFCCMLDLLDNTGYKVHFGNFDAALLTKDKEQVVSMRHKINDWSAILQDTHLIGAYVLINEICLSCHVPDHTASACEIPEAFTVLQTHLADTLGTVHQQSPGDTCVVKHSGQRLKRVNCDSAVMNMFTPDASIVRRLYQQREDTNCMEVSERKLQSERNRVLIRASHKSFHGKPRPTYLASSRADSESTLRSQPGSDRMHISRTDLPPRLLAVSKYNRQHASTRKFDQEPLDASNRRYGRPSIREFLRNRSQSHPSVSAFRSSVEAPFPFNAINGSEDDLHRYRPAPLGEPARPNSSRGTVNQDERLHSQRPVTHDHVRHASDPSSDVLRQYSYKNDNSIINNFRNYSLDNCDKNKNDFELAIQARIEDNLHTIPREQKLLQQKCGAAFF